MSVTLEKKKLQTFASFSEERISKDLVSVTAKGAALKEIVVFFVSLEGE